MWIGVKEVGWSEIDEETKRVYEKTDLSRNGCNRWILLGGVVSGGRETSEESNERDDFTNEITRVSDNEHEDNKLRKISN